MAQAGNLVQLEAYRQNSSGQGDVTVKFSRKELERILNLYSFMVAAGEWRDYAIDFLKDRAIFSVYLHARETPLYQIVKQPKLARRQGEWSVVTHQGQILKRGHDLSGLLRVFDRHRQVVSD